MLVTVKTLDSETRTFTVSDESTVDEFKAQIAEAVGIPVDRQRLIFKGKVLQDEAKLKEYEVDGCVIHLVERRPPSTRTRPDGASAPPGSTTGQPGGQTTTAANVLMGAFNLPVDVMGISQHIVQGIVNQLGLDSAHANISTSQSGDGSTLNVHINLLASTHVGNDVTVRISRARQFLTAARNSLNRTEGEGILPNPSAMDTSGPTRESSDASAPPPTTADSQPSSESASTATGDGQPSSEAPSTSSNRPSALAEVLREFQEFCTALQPSLDRYISLLNSNSTEELLPSDDSLPDRVAETLHNLSHGYHALSDLTFNVRAPEPRQVNVLPSLSPHTGTPPFLSSLLSGPHSAMPSNQGSSASTNPQQSGTSHASRVHVNPQGSSISFTSIISSALPRSAASQFTTSATQAREGPTGANSGVNGSQRMTSSNSTTSGTTTGTTSSTTRGGAHQGEGVRVIMDDFIALISNVNPVTSSQSQTSQTATPASSQGQSQSGTQTQTQSSSSAQINPSQINPSQINPSQINPSQIRRGLPNHPDPSVPCESFHFGPRTQRAPPQGPQQASSAEQNEDQGQSRPDEHELPQSVSDMIASVMQGAMANGAMHASSQQRSTADAGTNTSTSTTSSTQTGTAIGDSIMRSVMGLLSNVQSTEEQTHPPSATNSMSASQQQGSDSDSQRLRDAVLRDLVLEAYSHASTGEMESGPHQTINDVVSELQNRGLGSDSDNITIEGAMVCQLLTRIGTCLSLQDIICLMMGMQEPYGRLRGVLREYLYTDLLQGQETTDDNIHRVSTEFVSQLVAALRSILTSEPVREGIDVLATLTSFLEYYVRVALNVIRDTDEAAFTARFPTLMQDLSAEFFILLTMCLHNGLTGVQNIINNRLPVAAITRDMDSAMLQTFYETVTRYVRNTYLQRGHTDHGLDNFIVRTRDVTTESQQTQPTLPSAAAHSSVLPADIMTDSVEVTSQPSDDSDSFVTPPGSLTANEVHHDKQDEDQGEEVMDVDDIEEEEEEEDWKAVVPEDWVPIIAHDVMRQRHGLPQQPPFSDAYISGLPPKRRKTADQRAMCPTQETVPSVIRQAILTSGVTPRTSIDAVTTAARQNTELQGAYREEVQRTVRRRTDSDTDYKPDRFPNTRDYINRSAHK